jgi:hypothetical protein
LHYAIQKLHWSPSQVSEWLDAEQEMKALYYASTQVKIERDKKHADEAKRNR